MLEKLLRIVVPLYNLYSLYDLYHCIPHPHGPSLYTLYQLVLRLTLTLLSLILQLALVLPYGVVLYYTYPCGLLGGELGPLCIYTFFLLSCLLNKLLLKRLWRVVFELERKEGCFRFSHVIFREQSESNTMRNPEYNEKIVFKEMILAVLVSKQRIVTRQLFLSLAVNTCDYVGAIFSYIVLAIPIFAGLYDDVEHLGSVISQNAFMSMYLVFLHHCGMCIHMCVVTMVTTPQTPVTMVTMVTMLMKHSLAGLYQDSISETDDRQSLLKQQVTPPTNTPTIPPSITLSNLTIWNPVLGRGLVENLTLELSHHYTVLIHGPPGAGKSSVLRTIKSLWKPLTGTVSVTGDTEIMFLPQRPYFTLGSLRDQITLPDQVARGEADHILVGQLEEVGVVTDLCVVLGNRGREERVGDSTGCLGCLEKNEGITEEEHHLLDCTGNYYNVLTPGWQQLLSFARVLYHKPAILLLDEATSAVNCKDLFYSKLQDMNIVYLSVSHDEALDKYHTKVIRLKGDGKGWLFTGS
eukprot:sb/3479731/